MALITNNDDDDDESAPVNHEDRNKNDLDRTLANCDFYLFIMRYCLSSSVVHYQMNIIAKCYLFFL